MYPTLSTETEEPCVSPNCRCHFARLPRVPSGLRGVQREAPEGELILRLVVSLVGWLSQVLVVVVALLPDIVAKYCYRTFFPKPEHVVRELDVGFGAGRSIANIGLICCLIFSTAGWHLQHAY